jgi:hypothetical protein
MKLHDYPLKSIPIKIFTAQPRAATVIVLWTLAIGIIHVVLITLPGDGLKETTTRWASAAQVNKEVSTWPPDRKTDHTTDR